TRAKVLHHLGIVNRHAGSVGRAFEALRQSSNLAAELHLFSLESRANAVLSNLALHEEDDAHQQMAYAERAATAARKAGDTFALRTALLQLLSAAARAGDAEKVIAIEQRLLVTGLDESTRRYTAFFRSVRLAWEGRFNEAHQLLSCCWDQLHFDFDRVSAGAQYALCLALDERRDSSINMIRSVLNLANSLNCTSLFRARTVALSKAYCALAELANDRATLSLRILASLDSGDAVERVACRVVRGIHHRIRERGLHRSDEIDANIDELRALGYADAASLLRAVGSELARRSAEGSEAGCLTRSEFDVLRLLADGFAPKEIAGTTGRSVHTVRGHIANIIWKLECHSQLEAVELARRKGIL
ncbi:MAG: LuxR C-terminal-related transcriptional regulator, partial [Candidatus Cybelea sp.]